MQLIGVVCGAVDFGESDRIVRVLSDEQGRLSMMVRRARSSRKRWAGLLDVGCQLSITTKKGRGELEVLVTADLIKGPRRARETLQRIALLAYACELCYALSPEHAPAPKLHRLLVTLVDFLEGEHEPTMATRIALDAKALTFAGLTPALVVCSRCAKPLEGRTVWDPESGGGLHPHCGGGRGTSAADLAAIEQLRRTPLAETPSAALPRAAAYGMLCDFVQHHISRGIRSRSLVEDALQAG